MLQQNQQPGTNQLYIPSNYSHSNVVNVNIYSQPRTHLPPMQRPMYSCSTPSTDVYSTAATTDMNRVRNFGVEQQSTAPPSSSPPHYQHYNHVQNGSGTYGRPYHPEVSPEAIPQPLSSVVHHQIPTAMETYHSFTGPTPPSEGGCRCRRSLCLKKYCECYQNSTHCSGNCKCMNCKNYQVSLPEQLSSHNTTSVYRHHVGRPDGEYFANKFSDFHKDTSLRYRPEPISPMLLSSGGRNPGMDSRNNIVRCMVSSRPPLLPPPVRSDTSDTTTTQNEGASSTTTLTSCNSNESVGEETVFTVDVHQREGAQPASADEAMFQAAMAMTELLNGFPSPNEAETRPGTNDSSQGCSSQLTNTTIATCSTEDLPSIRADVETKEIETTVSTQSPPQLPTRQIDGKRKSWNEESNCTFKKIKSSTNSVEVASPSYNESTDGWVTVRQSGQITEGSSLPLSYPYEQEQRQIRNVREPKGISSSSVFHNRTLPMARNTVPTKFALPTRDHMTTISCSTKDESSHGSLYEEITRTCGLPKALSFRKICSRCGKTRSEHGELGFGNKCVYQHCGKCGANVQRHEQAGQAMGVLCKLSVQEGATPGAGVKYERKIRDLAARADLQRHLIRQRQYIFGDDAENTRPVSTPSDTATKTAQPNMETMAQ
jgi:Tesmin/TSO1-like CXC domain, cysteine-rich domain